MNFNTACRACLRDTINFVSLFDEVDGENLKFSKMLSDCIGADVTEADDFPKHICQSCVLKLPSVWKFIKMCKSSFSYLEKHLKVGNEGNYHKISELEDIKLEIKEEYEPTFINNDSSDREYSPDPEELRRPTRSKSGNSVFKRGRKKKERKSKLVNLDCTTCSHVASTKGGLKKHIKLFHPETLLPPHFPCSHCGKSFKRKSDRVVHMRVHSGERPFACAHCPSRFSQSGTLILHTRRHTGETPFRCAACPRLFSSHSSLRRHARAHSGERPFACERCGATFAQPGALRQHAAVHSDARPHACATCGRSLKSRLALRNHALTHGEKGFVCETCGKKFFVKANLDKHSKKMHRAEAGVCSVCGKPCSDLEQHMMSHSSLLRFQCPRCPQAFRTSQNLSFHVTTRHDNERKFPCPAEDCPRAFPKQNMLDFHYRKFHSDETPYMCTYCPNGFFRKSDLSRHLNTVHPNEKLSKQKS